MEIFKQLKEIDYKIEQGYSLEDLNEMMLDNPIVIMEFAMVLQFLREKYNIQITVDWWRNKWCYIIDDFSEETLKKVSPNRERQSAVKLDSKADFKTYNEALIKAIEESIKIIKTSQNDNKNLNLKTNAS